MSPVRRAPGPSFGGTMHGFPRKNRKRGKEMEGIRQGFGSWAGGLVVLLWILSAVPASAAPQPRTGSAEARAEVLLEEARGALAAGERTKARELAEQAVRTAPGHPVGYLVLLRLDLPRDLFGAALHLGQAVVACFRDFRWLLCLTGGKVLLLLVALTGAALAGWFVMMYRLVPVAVHDLREKNLDIKLLVPALLSVVGGLFYPVFFLSLLFWPYLGRRERAFAGILPLLLLLSSWLLPLAAANFSLPSTPRLKAALAVGSETGRAYALEILGPEPVNTFYKKL